MVIERVAHTIKRAYAMVVSSVEGGGPKTRVGTAARGHGELRAEIARFAQIAEIDGLTAQVPTPPGDHHHPCPKVRIPIVNEHKKHSKYKKTKKKRFSIELEEVHRVRQYT